MESSQNNSIDRNFKKIFEQKLLEYERQHQGNTRKPWTHERILEIINQIKNGKQAVIAKQPRTTMYYYWMAKYDVATFDKKEHLIFKRKTNDDLAITIIPREEYFEVLNTVHRNIGHGGRDKMKNIIKRKFYVPKKAIEIFIPLCPTCNTKKKISRGKASQLEAENITTKFSRKGHIFIIDYQSCPDGEYQWLLNYQDDATKFLNLRPLKSNNANEIAIELMKIFLIFGTPSILQCDRGYKFVTKVIEELTAMWPDCKGLSAGPKSYQIQGNTKKINQDVEKKLLLWMNNNKSTNWSVGCYFIQYQQNASIYDEIGKSPYKALFSKDPRPSLSSSLILSSKLTDTTTTTEQLRNQLNIQTFNGDMKNNNAANPIKNLEIKSEPEYLNMDYDVDEDHENSDDICSDISTENCNINHIKTEIEIGPTAYI